MNNYRQTYISERDRKVYAEESACQSEVKQLQNRYKKEKQLSDYIHFPYDFYDLIAVLLNIVLSPIIILFAISYTNQDVQRNNAEIKKQIADREKTCRTLCAKYKAECDKAIQAEETRYKTSVSQARKLYGGSVVMAPVVKWISDQFVNSIKGADRGIYIKNISATLNYRVDATQLVVLQWLPHAGIFSDGDRVIFDKGIGGCRYQNLPDLFHQIGFAQALAKQIEFQIISQFPKDPIAPSPKFVPKIQIDYDDCTMKLTYTVENPNYKAQVNFGTGVGK
jgi:hypothetical protein